MTDARPTEFNDQCADPRTHHCANDRLGNFGWNVIRDSHSARDA